MTSTSRSARLARPRSVGTPSLVPWLLGLRWAMLGALGLAMPVSRWLLELDVRWHVVVPVLAALALGNLGLAWLERAGRAPGTTRVVLAGTALDMGAMVVVLAQSGGPANPFSALLFVYVALAASLLPMRTALVVAVGAAIAFGALFALPSTACPAHADGAFNAHLYGMWAAFALGSVLIVHFVGRVRRALAARDAELESLRREHEEAAKFASLGALAAGTAHELGTPLGTIAVLAGEIAGQPGDDALARAHARSIAAQVERCREVLRRMRPGAAGPTTRATGTRLDRAVLAAVGAWRGAHPDVNVELSGEEARVGLSSADVEALVGVLLDNAHDAQREIDAHATILVSCGERSGAAYIAVEDAGAGLAAGLERRVGEPFVTTKEPGEGMGLGLFLVRSLLEPAGGRLSVERREPRGTRVRVEVPTPEELDRGAVGERA